jgi:hypothetical protein
MENLKALSGRLAIRLTGEKAPTSELIALALCHANCSRHFQNSECWLPLKLGFIIPVDDVRDLLPPLGLQDAAEGIKDARPDLIYVTSIPRKGLLFQFVEVKYRRHLRSARNADVLQSIRGQVDSLRGRWHEWYLREVPTSSFRSVRRAKLARVLHFYAEKAHRHHLTNEQFEIITAEIDRMIEKAGDYAFPTISRADRGWVFCPEYAGDQPMEMSSPDWVTRIFLFGPNLLPDSEFYREPIPMSSSESDNQSGSPPETEQSLTIAAGETDTHQASIDEQTAVPDIHPSSDSGPPSVSLGVDIITGTDVRWPLTIRGNPHLLIAGLPGMGKTTCLLSLARQMLAAEVQPIVFSYHPDFDERLQRLVPSLRFVDFHGLGFNPLQVLDRESRMAYLDVAGS